MAYIIHAHREAYIFHAHREAYIIHVHREAYIFHTHREKHISSTHTEKHISSTHTEKHISSTHTEKHISSTHTEKHIYISPASSNESDLFQVYRIWSYNMRICHLIQFLPTEASELQLISRTNCMTTKRMVKVYIFHFSANLSERIYVYSFSTSTG